MKRSVDDSNFTPKKSKKRKSKCVTVRCEWENCTYSAFISPSDYCDAFSGHLRKHADEFINNLKSAAGDSCPVSCCCMWRQCLWEGCEDLVDLYRHIMFHGYHAFLKGLGSLVQEELGVPACQIETDDPYHVFSYVVTPFVCRWNMCGAEFICPSEFYSHVSDHIDDEAKDIDVKLMRISCQWVPCASTATNSKNNNNNDESNTRDNENGNNEAKNNLGTSDPTLQICKQDFRDRHKLKEHARTHTHEKSLACPTCGVLFANRTKYLDHMSRQNEAAYEHFQCSHCLKRYASERLLRDHMRHHINYLKCGLCDMTCPNTSSLKYHMHYRHSDARQHACSVCEQKFKSVTDLNRHEETHLEKNYICGVQGCDFSCKTSRSLQSHMQTQHSKKKKKSYGCHLCNSVYLRGFLLTRHLKQKHNYSWPSGHPRFRYIEHEDGLHRLQMVRFQSVELTERLQQQDPAAETGCEYQGLGIQPSAATGTQYEAKENIPGFDATNDCGEMHLFSSITIKHSS